MTVKQSDATSLFQAGLGLSDGVGQSPRIYSPQKQVVFLRYPKSTPALGPKLVLPALNVESQTTPGPVAKQVAG